MQGFIERARGELQQIIADHNTIHELPKDHCLNGVAIGGGCQDEVTNIVIPHPLEAKDIMLIDTDFTYQQSLLPDNKLWTAGIFDSDTFLTRAEVDALGYFSNQI